MVKMRVMMLRAAGVLILGLVVVGVCGSAAFGADADYLGPRSLALSADGSVLYVACEDARQVAWVRTAMAR
jgi:hypothetical protein